MHSHPLLSTVGKLTSQSSSAWWSCAACWWWWWWCKCVDLQLSSMVCNHGLSNNGHLFHKFFCFLHTLWGNWMDIAIGGHHLSCNKPSLPPGHCMRIHHCTSTGHENQSVVSKDTDCRPSAEAQETLVPQQRLQNKRRLRTTSCSDPVDLVNLVD